MSAKAVELLGIGNALVDVLANVDDRFIESEEANGMIKGAMVLVDEGRAKAVYDKMPPSVEVSGGSAANTMAGFASFGGNGAFIGKVAKDQLGDVFEHDLKAQGIDYRTSRLIEGPETGRCMILVTPDAQRTMNTFLGASIQLRPDDIDAELVAKADISYLEGYLFDPEHAKDAFRKAGDIVKQNNKKLALTLSDTFCVDRHREDFLDLVSGPVDIVFANEEELKTLFQTDDLMAACDAIAQKCDIAAVTRGEKGSVVIHGEERFDIAAIPPSDLVDTTGAGDLYAAGFLYGQAKGKSLAECGHLGSVAAAEVISHMGPRPKVSLADLAKKAA